MCTPDLLNMQLGFSVSECVGSDHLPLHCHLTFGQQQPNNPIFTRKVSQIDHTRFKKLIDDRVTLLPGTFETARELDKVADLLPKVVLEAFESSCPLKQVVHKRKPITPFIMGLIKKEETTSETEKPGTQ